jgi:hypothetical protein
MPLVAKAQKSLRIMMKSSFPIFSDRRKTPFSEKDIGDELLHLVWLAENSGVDAESALRRALTALQGSYLQSGQN